MCEFIREIALPVVGYCLGVALCIGVVLFAAAVVCDFVSDPTEIVWSDAQ